MISYLLCLLSFNFDWKDKSKTQDSVWPYFQTPWSSSKILRYASYFQLSSRYLKISIEKINQKCKTVFDHISKHLEVRQKFSATRRIYSSQIAW